MIVVITANQWLADLDVGDFIKVLASSVKQRSLLDDGIKALSQSLLQFWTLLFHHLVEVLSIFFDSSLHFFHFLLGLIKNVSGSQLAIGLNGKLRHN